MYGQHRAITGTKQGPLAGSSAGPQQYQERLEAFVESLVNADHGCDPVILFLADLVLGQHRHTQFRQLSPQPRLLLNVVCPAQLAVVGIAGRVQHDVRLRVRAQRLLGEIRARRLLSGEVSGHCGEREQCRDEGGFHQRLFYFYVWHLARRRQDFRGRAESPLYIINNVAFLVGVRWLVRVYAHLGQVRHRSEVVEYQLEHHHEALGERLTALETLTT